MKKYYNIERLFPVFILILIVLFFKWFDSGFVIQEHRDDLSYVGKSVKFSQPISYIERETPAITPIVVKIKKEITGFHLKYDSEKKNEYIPSNTTFIIEDAYSVNMLFNPYTIYYILSNQGVKYILSEDTLIRLQKPIYKDAQVPMQTLDELYKKKQYATSTIKFYLSEKSGRYYDLFSINQFKECNAQNIITNESSITATINFNQLSCLYFKLWDNLHSKSYPVKYEILE